LTIISDRPGARPLGDRAGRRQTIFPNCTTPPIIPVAGAAKTAVGIISIAANRTPQSTSVARLVITHFRWASVARSWVKDFNLLQIMEIKASSRSIMRLGKSLKTSFPYSVEINVG
jgi:hypothetical protein